MIERNFDIYIFHVQTCIIDLYKPLTARCESAPDFEKCEKSEAVKKIKGKTNPGECSNALSRKTYIRPWREDEVEYCWLLQGDIVFCQHIVIESQMGKKYGAEAHVFSSNRISLASRTARLGNEVAARAVSERSSRTNTF